MTFVTLQNILPLVVVGVVPFPLTSNMCRMDIGWEWKKQLLSLKVKEIKGAAATVSGHLTESGNGRQSNEFPPPIDSFLILCFVFPGKQQLCSKHRAITVTGERQLQTIAFNSRARQLLFLFVRFVFICQLSAEFCF